MSLIFDFLGRTKYFGVRISSSRITIVKRTIGNTGDLSKYPAGLVWTAYRLISSPLYR
jgi:hypothetical protein